MLNQTVRAGEGYRPDLDGLRGLAVAAVVAYHLDVPFVPGGFVGVDIFFVLSGFLITRLIATELRDCRFSLVGFYERRVRRIVPALVFVSAATAAMAFGMLLPDELERFARTLVATVFSISNIYFLKNSGYFDPAASTEPLLHTWSLGIEEQFYIVFPLLLMAVYRWRPQWLAATIWLIFAASLVASIAFLPAYPLGTFYLLHARAWELLAGAIVALGLVPRPRSDVERETAMTVGLAAVAIAIFAYNTKTPFPGAAALLPCIGTALAIWAGDSDRGTLGGRLLAWKPLTALGLVSYSLYLWHWPLIVFFKLATSERLHASEQVGLAAASLALATLTWYFVEQPFRRRGPEGFASGSIFRAGALGLGALASTAIALVAMKGMPQRFPSIVMDIAAARADASPLRAKCHFIDKTNRTYDDTCVIGDNVPPSAIIYGDSHGAEFSAALGEFAKSRHTSVRQITASACPPIAGFSYPGETECAIYNAGIVNRLTALAPTTIVLATYSLAWARDYPDKFWPGLESTITSLRAAGHRVIVLGPVPDMRHGASIPAAVARWTAKGHDPNDFSFKVGAEEIKGVETRLNGIATAQGAIFIPVSPELCTEGGCKPYADGTVFYFDNNHLSMSGAQRLASRLLVPIIWPEADISHLNAPPPPY